MAWWQIVLIAIGAIFGLLLLIGLFFVIQDSIWWANKERNERKQKITAS